MKPILFSGEMVEAIQENRKTVTRRPVRPKLRDHEVGFQIIRDDDTGQYIRCEYYDEYGNETRPMNEPYRKGGILYVRETWNFLPCIDCPEKEECKRTPEEYSDREMVAEGCYIYKEAVLDPSRICWRPSIHMPREAARIFLRVKRVIAQKVKDITDDDAIAEGFASREDFVVCFMRMYPDCTEDSWVWAIEFKQINKAEALICSVRLMTNE